MQMSTIEELVTAALDAAAHHDNWILYLPPEDPLRQETKAAEKKAKAAITKPWTAAAEAMRREIERCYRQARTFGNRGWICNCCGAMDDYEPQRHTVGRCQIAALQAARAAMDGTDE